MERLKGKVISRVETLKRLIDNKDGWSEEAHAANVTKLLEHNLLSMAKAGYELGLEDASKSADASSPVSDLTHLYQTIPELTNSLSTKTWN